jgi:glutathione S-transferase
VSESLTRRDQKIHFALGQSWRKSVREISQVYAVMDTHQANHYYFVTRKPSAASDIEPSFAHIDRAAVVQFLFDG